MKVEIRLMDSTTGEAETINASVFAFEPHRVASTIKTHQMMGSNDPAPDWVVLSWVESTDRLAAAFVMRNDNEEYLVGFARLS